MARKKPPQEHENLERWLVSYGDFITLLFATFVVLYALSQIDLSEYSKLEDGLRKAFNAPSLLEGSASIMEDDGNSILDASSADSTIAPLMLEYISQKYEEQAYEDIKDEINQMSKNGDLEGVDAQITDKGLLITFKDDLLFYSASATLTDKAMKTLDSVGVIVGEKFALHMIRVEGYTDDQPINTFMYPSNWELSSARACSIVRYFISRFKFMPNIFTAIGYAETRPIVPNTDDKNRAKNRRVEILILKNKFKSIEHASNSIMKQSKEAQKRFQKDRMVHIQSVKESSKELQKIKMHDVKNDLTNKSTEKTTSEFYAEPVKEQEKSISIKNKNIYEKTIKKTEPKLESHDDDFINIKNNQILKRDINKQFDSIGQ